MIQITDLTKTLRQLEIYTNRKVDEIFAGNYRSAFKGRGLEVDDLRKYEDGDDARHIDWSATAKTGQAFVKQYKETRELTTMLLVDVSATMNFGSVAKMKKDLALEVSATLLFSALKNNDKFGAVLFGGEKNIYIPPRKGRTHLLRILRDLISAYNEPNLAKKSLNPALEMLLAMLKRKALCFLVSDEIGAESAQLLSIVSRKNDFLFLKINDPFENGQVVRGLYRVADWSGDGDELVDLTNENVVNRFVEIRQAKNIAQEQLLKERRIDFLSLQTDGDAFRELRLFFKKRQKRL